MATFSSDLSFQRSAKPFGQLLTDALSPASALIEPLGFSIVTVGVLTPLGVVPVVMVQKTPKATTGNG